MSKYSRQDTVYFSLISEKRSKITSDVIGPISDSLPFLIDANSDKLFSTFINEIGNNYFDYKNKLKNVPYLELFNYLNLIKLNNSFFYKSMNLSEGNNILGIQNDTKETQDIYNTDLFLSNVLDYDLIFRVMDCQDGYYIDIYYNSNLYDKALIQAILN